MNIKDTNNLVPITNEFSKATNFRKYVLLTLSMADATPPRVSVSKEDIIKRITRMFTCKSIVIAKEEHMTKGSHFYIGILIERGVHRKAAPRELRNIFPEFYGGQLHVVYYKAWATILKFLLTEDSQPFIWGELTLQHIQESVKAQEMHKKMPDRNQWIVAQKL